MNKACRAALARWRVVARKIGEFQSRVVLALMYFVVMAPFAIGLRCVTDPLRLRAAPVWHPLPSGESTPRATAARQQF
jgi:hypothetical protein